MHHWAVLFKTSEIFSAIIFITVIFVVLSAGFVFFIIRFKVRQGLHHQEKKQMEETFSRQLLQSQIEVQEETMTLLGQELHDNICQQMSSTKLMAGYARRRPEEAAAMIFEIEELLSKTIHDIRELTRSIDKDWLTQFDLIANLQTEINRINATGSLNITIASPPQLYLTHDKQLLLFRIIQEAIQNAIRHSGASLIDINVNDKTDTLVVTITDNGQGFNTRANTGLGMRNMRDRAGLLKGQIEWRSDISGSTVFVQIPSNEK